MKYFVFISLLLLAGCSHENQLAFNSETPDWENMQYYDFNQ
jgi:uncharacterized protein YcfL